ncbi:MAG: GNAT family N-acetyltransferase [Acidobacteria bacterium]|nr:GNAT family N-acetyltransferase [Acidobacteriota bacterium]
MILIRSCSGHDELEACVQLQIETWGYDETDVIPRKAFLVSQKIGGQVIGAFDTDLPGAGSNGAPESMVGFAVSFPGVKTGVHSGNGRPQPYLHSHMLAVLESYRDRGVGAQLKLEQRREALSRGIRVMEWTFDPLEIKNAHLNIYKLGAVVRSYLVNFYGVSSSRLQGGLPTDRLVAEWYLDSDRVKQALKGKNPPEQQIEERIEVPASIYKWKASSQDRDRALALQAENRRRFQDSFSRGLAVVAFNRDAQGNGVFELGHWPQPEIT